MRTKILGLLAVGLLAGPMTLNATMVTWEMRGTITGASGSSPEFPFAQVGDAYLVTWSFDASAAVVRTFSFPPGTRYDYDPSIVMTIQVGSSQPAVFSTQSQFPRLSYLRDDSSDQPVNGQPADGISFLIARDAPQWTIDLTFRTDDTNVVNGPGLPVDPYVGMAGYPVSFFRYVYVGPITTPTDGWTLIGDDVASVRRVDSQVPEPGTLTLIGFGLAGLGLSRRRKA